MIEVKVSSNTTRASGVYDPNTVTVRSVLEEHDIQYNSCTVHMDGMPLVPGDLDKTFSAFGITEKTYLSAVVKQDNK